MKNSFRFGYTKKHLALIPPRTDAHQAFLVQTFSLFHWKYDKTSSQNIRPANRSFYFLLYH